MERSLEPDLARLARLNLVGELGSAVAHELNQPLAAIVNYAGGCIRRLEAQGEPELVEALEAVIAQAERAGEIVRALRRFAGRKEVRRAPCSLGEIVRATCQLVAPRTRQLEVTIELDLARGTDLVLADFGQVQEVLLNLVRNSYEALDAAGCDPRRIRITTRPHGPDALEVEVADSGPGLAPGALAEAFEPFTSTRAGAIGLGLTISRSIVEAHGGRLWYGEGPGAAFCFTLPRAAEKMGS